MHGSQKWEDGIVGEASALSFTAIKSAPLAAVTGVITGSQENQFRYVQFRYVVILD